MNQPCVALVLFKFDIVVHSSRCKKIYIYINKREMILHCTCVSTSGELLQCIILANLTDFFIRSWTVLCIGMWS